MLAYSLLSIFHSRARACTRVHVISVRRICFMFHFYVSTHWKSNVSRDETLVLNVSFLVSMFHFLFTTPLSKKLSGREIKPQWERFKTSMGEKSNPNGRNTTETLKSKMKHRMPMFSLKKELGIAKVICKPLVLVPKTAQKSCLSKLGEMAHV